MKDETKIKDRINQERLSIRTASKALGVSEKSIQRYIERGILTRIKDGYRVFLLSDEVRELRKKRQTESKKRIGQETKQTVTIPIETYNSLLTELAEVKAKSNYLIEYKHINEKLSKELDETRGMLKENDGFLKETFAENKKIGASNEDQHNEIEELKKNLKSFQKELDRMKSRGLIKRILNK